MSSTPCLRQGRINILGIGVSAINMNLALEQMACCIDHHLKTYVVICPVYTLMQGVKRVDMRAVLNQAGMVTPDGMPLVFLSRWKGYSSVERVYGPDLMLAFSELAAERGYTNFYYGGTEGVPEKLANIMTRRFPGLKVVGTYSPPFRELTSEEEDMLIEMINRANADVVWVGLGSPKQDFWMAKYREKLNASILIGVGAAFDFYTGRTQQAPRWMQRAALEWAFRLWTEPRRLWRRYLIYNPLFIWKVFLQATGLKKWYLE